MENILVLDSGIGGLYTVNVLKQEYPQFNYIYFKDSFNCPYGNKCKEDLFKIAQININFVLKRCKIAGVVLACNTLSTNCVNELKSVYNFPIFTVEPPLNKISKPCLVLCTKTCYNALKRGLSGKEKSYSEITTFETIINNQRTIFCAMHNLAFKIEQNIKNKTFLYKYLQKVVQPVKTENINQIILGCTHYNFVKQEINAIVTSCEFLEGSQFVNLKMLES